MGKGPPPWLCKFEEDFDRSTPHNKEGWATD